MHIVICWNGEIIIHGVDLEMWKGVDHGCTMLPDVADDVVEPAVEVRVGIHWCGRRVGQRDVGVDHGAVLNKRVVKSGYDRVHCLLGGRANKTGIKIQSTIGG